ncbi:MAG TPA: T9SS type A sorting domain-containing protein [Candidatus Acidoferrales bacterium]|nr:T9SS type A sorting domain-containing protein [Candidatus Acidoferrales bacterium]
MKKSICLLVTFFIALSSGKAQQFSCNFLTSHANATLNRVRHSNPLLFPNSDNGFLLVWDDYRNDSLAYYAQLFDSLGNAIGKNFPIFSNTLIAFAPDSSFFTEKYNDVDIGGPYFEINFIGYLCKLDGTWSLSFFNRGDPETGTDCVGICAGGQDDLLGSANGYINLSSDNGRLSVSASDWTNKGLWNWFTGYDMVIYVTNYSATNDSEGNFAVAWLNARFQGSSNIPIYEIMGSFFDKNGDTLATNVLLRSDTLSNLDLGWWQDERLTIVPLADSLYELFDYDPYSFALSYWKVDPFGHTVGKINTFEVYHDTSANNVSAEHAANLALTPLIKDRFSSVITVYESGTSAPRNYNSVLNFDGNGDPTGMMLEDTTINFLNQKYLFVTPDSVLLVPAVKDSDIYLIAYQGLTLKWSKKINDDIVGVKETGSTLPTSFMLSQNYPNPFNPSTTISYQIPEMSHVTMKIFDVLGREVATIVDERKMPGTYEVKFDGSRFASGVYFCRMNAGNYLATKKLMLLK